MCRAPVALSASHTACSQLLRAAAHSAPLQGGLALVGRAVRGADAAAVAAADGANFVILDPEDGSPAPSGSEAAAARSRQRSSQSIPVIAAASAAASGAGLRALLEAGVDGLVMGLGDLEGVAAALTQQQPAGASAAAAAVVQQLGGAASVAATDAQAAAAVAAPAAPQKQQAAQLSQLLSSSREELVDAERQLFAEVRCPMGHGAG